jgi:hypothetical protein
VVGVAVAGCAVAVTMGLDVGCGPGLAGAGAALAGEAVATVIEVALGAGVLATGCGFVAGAGVLFAAGAVFLAAGPGAFAAGAGGFGVGAGGFAAGVGVGGFAPGTGLFAAGGGVLAAGAGVLGPGAGVLFAADPGVFAVGGAGVLFAAGAGVFAGLGGVFVAAGVRATAPLPLEPFGVSAAPGVAAPIADGTTIAAPTHVSVATALTRARALFGPSSREAPTRPPSRTENAVSIAVGIDGPISGLFAKRQSAGACNPCYARASCVQHGRRTSALTSA